MLTANDTNDYSNIESAIRSIYEAITLSIHYYEECKQAHEERSKSNPDNNSISFVKKVDETLRKVNSSLSS